MLDLAPASKAASKSENRKLQRRALSSDGEPVGGIGDETHQATGDGTSDGHGDEPTEVDPSDHAPVNSTPITVAKTNTDNGAGDALSGRNGEF